MSERMNKERAIELLKNDCCYECSWGCRNPIECNNKECDYRQALDIAIESLEREELSDDFKKTAWEIATENKTLRADNEWVDVRDRLPSDDEIAENYGEFEITYFDTILKHQVTIAEFCKSNKYAIVEKDERGYWYDWEDDEIIRVIAWRPLPKPYERKE